MPQAVESHVQMTDVWYCYTVHLVKPTYVLKCKLLCIYSVAAASENDWQPWDVI